jgi:Spy/CpxP family protein refolding chaperone
MQIWRYMCVLGAVALAALALPDRAAAQGFKWWQSETFQREMSLSAEQTARLEEIFQGAVPALRAQKQALDKIEDEFSALVADGRADESQALEHITRLEAARSELGRTRGLMLYRMRRILTSDQHVKLKVLHDQYERDRRRGQPSGRGSKPQGPAQ